MASNTVDFSNYTDNSPGMNQTLTVVTYNMHGFAQGFSTILDLSDSIAPDIYLLQEHWLTPANLSKFDKTFPNYFMFGSSAMSKYVESGIVRGRPFGGVMIMVKNELRKFTQTVVSEERYVIIKVCDYLIVDLYLPCASTIDRQLIVENTLADVISQIETFPACRLLVGGDFNCNLDCNDSISSLVRNFTRDLGLQRCDEAVGCHQYFSYVNDALNSYSCIDFFF